MGQQLKAPFPWFGGKRTVAALVWSRLGDVDNYIEPFAGSCAVLLLRPHAPRIETVNDLDPYVANFWRATSTAGDAEAVAEHADWPVNEADLHSRHRWLVLSDDAAEFRRRMRTEPDYFDARIAGWWCWGLCCWIGSGWCDSSFADRAGVQCGPSQQLPLIGDPGRGEHRGPGPSEQIPILSSALGVNAEGAGELVQKRQALGNSRGVPSTPRRTSVPPRKAGATRPDPSSSRPALSNSCGVPSTPREEMHEKIPNIDSRGLLGKPRESLAAKRDARGQGHGVTAINRDNNRPQLADAFARGRGVNGNDLAETCAARRAWLLDWFRRLRDRFRTVRVCCGHWSRVCSSESVTTRLGLTGVFLDPPYAHNLERMMAWVHHLRDGGPEPKQRRGSDNRNGSLYSTDGEDVDRLVAEVHLWCVEWGAKPGIRIALCGYCGEHDTLEALGWSVEAWKAQGGYGNRSAKGKANAAKERTWFSPGCLHAEQPDLFAAHIADQVEEVY